MTTLFAGCKKYNQSIYHLIFQFWKSNDLLIEPLTDSGSYMYCFGRCFHYGKKETTQTYKMIQLSHYCYLWYPRHHKRPLVLNIEATSKEGKIVNFKSFCSLYFTGQNGLNTVGKWEKIKRLRNTNE